MKSYYFNTLKKKYSIFHLLYSLIVVLLLPFISLSLSLCHKHKYYSSKQKNAIRPNQIFRPLPSSSIALRPPAEQGREDAHRGPSRAVQASERLAGPGERHHCCEPRHHSQPLHRVAHLVCGGVLGRVPHGDAPGRPDAPCLYLGAHCIWKAFPAPPCCQGS